MGARPPTLSSPKASLEFETRHLLLSQGFSPWPQSCCHRRKSPQVSPCDTLSTASHTVQGASVRSTPPARCLGDTAWGPSPPEAHSLWDGLSLCSGCHRCTTCLAASADAYSHSSGGGMDMPCVTASSCRGWHFRHCGDGEWHLAVRPGRAGGTRVATGLGSPSWHGRLLCFFQSLTQTI